MFGGKWCMQGKLYIIELIEKENESMNRLTDRRTTKFNYSNTCTCSYTWNWRLQNSLDRIGTLNGTVIKFKLS